MIVRLDFGRAARRTRSLRIGATPGADVQVVAELGSRLPFLDNSADEIFIDRSLAHAEDFASVMEELWRISKPGTIVHIRLPHASSSWATSRDPRHSGRFTLETFNYFDPRLKDGLCDTTAAFHLEHAWLHLTGPRRNARGLAVVRGAFGKIVEGLANQSRGMQYRWERWLAPAFGGFEEFSVVLSAVKDHAYR